MLIDYITAKRLVTAISAKKAQAKPKRCARLKIIHDADDGRGHDDDE